MMYNLPLPDYVKIMGEDRAKRALSSFSVSRNSDVEGFIRNNALIYQKSHNARTYIIVDDSFLMVGYFTISMACMEIPEGISKNLRRKLQGFGRHSAETVPCFLLGQIARDDSVTQKVPCLSDMLDMSINYILRAQTIIGGRFISLDCLDALVHLYEKHGFQKISRVGELNQMIMFIG